MECVREKRRDLRRRKADTTNPLVAFEWQTHERDEVTPEQLAERQLRAKAAHKRISNEDIESAAQLVFDESWAAPGCLMVNRRTAKPAHGETGAW